MSRAAPTVNGTPTIRKVSLRWIDASGDPRADSIDLPAGATNAQIEAYAVAISDADASNASLYAIDVTDAYQTVPDKNNAVDAPKDSVYDNLVFLAKTAAGLSKRGFVPAPAGAMFVAGTDTIDPANAELAAIFTAFLAMVGAGYSIKSARYTERREINEAVNI
jgi:hypothetical protein